MGRGIQGHQGLSLALVALFVAQITLCGAQGGSSCEDVPGYKFYASSDRYAGDLMPISGSSYTTSGAWFAALAQACNQTCTCNAFNTEGWMKKKVNASALQPVGGSRCAGIYVREAPDAPDCVIPGAGCAQVPGFTFYSMLDTPGADIVRGSQVPTNNATIIQQLGTMCNDTCNCGAFNTDGWLKRRDASRMTEFLLPINCSGVYYRNAGPAACRPPAPPTPRPPSPAPSPPLPVCAQLPGYTFLRRQDFYGNDMVRGPASTNVSSLMELARSCNATCTCNAFNTDGWLKRNVSSRTSSWPSGNPAYCAGLYVRFNASAPPECTPAVCPQLPGYTFYPLQDYSYNTIRQLDTPRNASELQEAGQACNVTCSCNAVNTAGALKQRVAPTILTSFTSPVDPCSGIYLRDNGTGACFPQPPSPPRPSPPPSPPPRPPAPPATGCAQVPGYTFYYLQYDPDANYLDYDIDSTRATVLEAMGRTCNRTCGCNAIDTQGGILSNVAVSKLRFWAFRDPTCQGTYIRSAGPYVCAPSPPPKPPTPPLDVICPKIPGYTLKQYMGTDTEFKALLLGPLVMDENNVTQVAALAALCDTTCDCNAFDLLSVLRYNLTEGDLYSMYDEPGDHLPRCWGTYMREKPTAPPECVPKICTEVPGFKFQRLSHFRYYTRLVGYNDRRNRAENASALTEVGSICNNTCNCNAFDTDGQAINGGDPDRLTYFYSPESTCAGVYVRVNGSAPCNALSPPPAPPRAPPTPPLPVASACPQLQGYTFYHLMTRPGGDVTSPLTASTVTPAVLEGWASSCNATCPCNAFTTGGALKFNVFSNTLVPVTSAGSYPCTGIYISQAPMRTSCPTKKAP